MLKNFDWIRRCRSGTELLATLVYLSEDPAFSSDEEKIGPPHSALDSPCERCWIYPREEGGRYCRFCKAILARARKVYRLLPNSAMIWGYVNQLPGSLRNGEEASRSHILGAYVHDEHHFLAMMQRRWIKRWIQEWVIQHGADLKGVVQIVPSMAPKPTIGMGDILCKAIHNETSLPMDKMRVRFYSAPMQMITTRKRDRKRLLDFEISEFLGLLEMAEVFRVLLRPNEQKELFELLTLNDAKEEQFYWGRFVTFLDQRAKDMLAAWNIRKWPRSRIQLLYEVVDYVYVDLSQGR